MSASNLIRLGGLATIVSGALFIVFPLVVGALLLVPVGMVGFHALQRQSYGRIGHAGFWLVIVASLVVALGLADYLIRGDYLQELPPAWLGGGVLVLVVGFVLYGVATLQAKVLPRWCGVAFIVASPAALALSIPLPFVSVFIVFGLAWIALGYALWFQRASPRVQRPRRAR
jgi:hypothetical protein